MFIPSTFGGGGGGLGFLGLGRGVGSKTKAAFIICYIMHLHKGLSIHSKDFVVVNELVAIFINII